MVAVEFPGNHQNDPGLTGFAYSYGLSALWLFPACVGGFLINWYLVAPRLSRMSRENGALTLTEFIAGPRTINQGPGGLTFGQNPKWSRDLGYTHTHNGILDEIGHPELASDLHRRAGDFHDRAGSVSRAIFRRLAAAAADSGFGRNARWS